MARHLYFTSQSKYFGDHWSSNNWSRNLKNCVFVMWNLNNSTVTNREPEGVAILAWKILAHFVHTLIPVWSRCQHSFAFDYVVLIWSIVQHTSLTNKQMRTPMLWSRWFFHQTRRISQCNFTWVAGSKFAQEATDKIKRNYLIRIVCKCEVP